MSVRIRIDHDTTDLVRAMGVAPGATARAADRRLGRGAQEVARTAKEKAPKTQSTLTNSLRSRKLGELDYEVVAGAVHASYVELGTGPGGWPPPQALREWIRTKGVQPRDSSLTEDELAFLIGRSIHRKGTPEQPFMRPALEEHRDRLQELVAAGAREGLEAAGLG